MRRHSLLMLLRKKRTTRIVSTGLLAEWRFTDGSGATLKDWGGNGYNGTLGASTAAPTWSSAGLTFAGAQYVNLYSASLGTAFPGTLGTLEIVWTVDVAGTWGDATERYSVMFGGDANNSRAITKYSTANLVRYRNVTAATLKALTPTVGPTVAYHHFVTTWNQSGDAINCYLDGALVSGSPLTAIGTWGASGLQTDQAVIGAINTSAGSGFKGTIAYAVLRNAALSGAEVATEYTRLKSILALRGVTL